MNCIYQEVIKLDKELQFDRANNIWEKLIEEDITYLERRLKDLITLQEVHCKSQLTQCHLSMTYHYQVTCLLEKYGRLLDYKRYYYRAYTYILTADYLSHINLYECAVDCYFRALIFQTNFKANDTGYLKIKTILGIIHCYDALKDKEMIRSIEKEFTKEAQTLSPLYKKIWQVLWQILCSKYNITNNKKYTQLEMNQEIKDLLDTYNYTKAFEIYINQ